MTPTNRKEQFYAGMAGQADSVPTPINREEQWYKEINDNIHSGGGGDVTKDYVDQQDAKKVDKVEGKGLSTNDYTDAEKTKLDGIETGAEANVQSDWSQDDDTADDYIKNKPTIPDVSDKADKVTSATAGNFAGLDSNGNLIDSGKKPSDFATPSDVATEEISSTSTGTSITLTDSADGYLQGITVKGHSEVVDGEIRSIGDPGWGVVDLGTLTWTLYDTTETRSAFYCTVSGSTTISDPTAAPDFICSAFNVIAYTSSWTPGTITQGTNGVVIVNADPSITTAQALAAAMSGVLLYYHFADALFVSPRLGITCKNGAGQGTVATITTGLPLRSTLDGTVYDELTNDSVITRCEVVNGEVVAKATPVITPLTSTEKTVLASLRTYNPNTQIDVTDSPSMTVNYLLNTDNGQAVAKVDKRSTSFDATVTLAAASWTGASAPYTQTVSIQGITANDTPIIDVVVSPTVATGLAEIADFANITKATTGAGTITFSCYESKPTNDLTVNVKVVR